MAAQSRNISLLNANKHGRNHGDDTGNVAEPTEPVSKGQVGRRVPTRRPPDVTGSATEHPSRRRRLCQSPDPNRGFTLHTQVRSSSTLSRTGRFRTESWASQLDAPRVPAQRAGDAAGPPVSWEQVDQVAFCWEAVRHRARQALRRRPSGVQDLHYRKTTHVHACSAHTHVRRRDEVHVIQGPEPRTQANGVPCATPTTLLWVETIFNLKKAVFLKVNHYIPGRRQ